MSYALHSGESEHVWVCMQPRMRVWCADAGGERESEVMEQRGDYWAGLWKGAGAFVYEWCEWTDASE